MHIVGVTRRSGRARLDNRIILFRFHNDFDATREKLRIARHFNPNLPIHGLYGGTLESAEEAQAKLADVLDSFWAYPVEKDKNWKWMHTDIMTKQWFREVGKSIEFDYMYSYEYDLLTLAPLIDLYPEVTDGEIALAAAEPFTDAIEKRWMWTNKEPYLAQYKKYRKYMEKTFGLERQHTVCLGPGPLLSREFMKKFAATEDVDFVHEELTLPAYAEVFGIAVKNHGLHPGFFAHSDEDQYFNCFDSGDVAWEAIAELIESGRARRAFHPVKGRVSLDAVTQLLSGDQKKS
jgi:hypothetical protein